MPFGGERFWDQPDVAAFVRVLQAINKPYQEGYLARAVNFPSRIMDNFLFQDLVFTYRLEGLPTYRALITLANINGEWPNAYIFGRRCQFLLEKSEECKISSASKIIESLIAYYNNERIQTGIDSDEVISRLDFADRIRKLAIEFEKTNKESSLASFLDYLSFVSLETEQGFPGEEEAANLITCHHSKGLEFPIVFIPGLQVGVFPNDYFIQSEEELEQERRLLYVAITRAIELLYLTCYDDPIQGSATNPIITQGFLAEIPVSYSQT